MATTLDLEAAFRATTQQIACLRRQTRLARQEIEQARAELREFREGMKGAAAPPPARLTLLPQSSHMKHGEATVDARADEARQANLAIAVLEDDSALLALFHELLEEEGYQVVALDGPGDGQALLAQGPPRLVILDWHWRGGAGGERALAALRSDPATADVPVLICTADTRVVREQAERLAAVGARVLAKPFEVDELLACVATLMNASTDGSTPRVEG